jgi:hypothetical protein
MKEMCLSDSINLYEPRSKFSMNQYVCSQESFFTLLTMNGEWRGRSIGKQDSPADSKRSKEARSGADSGPCRACITVRGGGWSAAASACASNP